MSSDRRDRDRADLAAALDLIRAALPTARTVHLATSARPVALIARYGFVLGDVLDADGVSLLDGGDLGDAEDELCGLLSDLDWHGAVGEDRYGYATIDLYASVL